jgi:hypothetical protein
VKDTSPALGREGRFCIYVSNIHSNLLRVK